MQHAEARTNAGPTLLRLPGYLIPRKTCSRNHTTFFVFPTREKPLPLFHLLFTSPAPIQPNAPATPNSSDGLLLTHRNKRLFASLLGDAGSHPARPYHTLTRSPSASAMLLRPVRLQPDRPFVPVSALCHFVSGHCANLASGSASKQAILVFPVLFRSFAPLVFLEYIIGVFFGGGEGTARRIAGRHGAQRSLLAGGRGAKRL